MGVFKQAGLQGDAWAALPSEPFERDDVSVLPAESALVPDIVVDPSTASVIEITINVDDLKLDESSD